MTLNYYEVMTAGSPEYEMVEKLVRTVSLSDPEKRTITLETRTDDWNVNFIRHKTRKAYRIDDKYIVTVTAIRESQFNEQPSNTYVSVTPDLYHKTHTEIEVKNGVSTNTCTCCIYRTEVSLYIILSLSSIICRIVFI